MKIKKFDVGDVSNEDEWTIAITREIVTRLLSVPSVTVQTNDDKNVCVMGGDVIAPGVAFVVMMCTKRIKEFPIATIKEVKQALSFFISYHQLRKIYTTAITSTQRWVEWVGFNQEYVMKDVFGEGEHMYGYAMTLSELIEGD